MKSKKRTNQPPKENSKASAIKSSAIKSSANADLGLNFDDQMIQFIGNPAKLIEGVEPTFREMTLDDIEDDCPACRANRKRILAGNPPMAYVFE